MFTYFLQYIFYQFKTVSKITLGIIRKWPLKIETISITLGNTVKHRSKLERKVKTMFTDNMTLVYTGIIFLHQFIVLCRYSFFFFSLQIEGFWALCIEQDYQHHFSKSNRSLCVSMSLCLLILIIFQTFSLLLDFL